MLEHKIRILADAAKFDASCSSSGAPRRDSAGSKGIGSTGGMGICHSYAPDGRCISLLKILLTNWCIYDCLYCVNRESSNTPRARFKVEELVALTMDFYRRNLIEGLFLSSGIIRSPDYTMEQLMLVAKKLREEERFRGYIHLKSIPDCSEELLTEAGKYADRLSINVELPSDAAMKTLAPEKDIGDIKRAMGRIRLAVDDNKEARKARAPRTMAGAKPRIAKPPRFAPAGQTTQMVIGADDSNDASILRTSTTLYRNYQLRRVYYSAFSPIPGAPAALPSRAAPLMREHRLYQADWLMRFYGFECEEIATDGGMLSLDIDPKMAWALAHPEHFPVDLNRASKEMLLRVPGLGPKSVQRLLTARRVRSLRTDDLQRMRLPRKRVLPFVVLPDHRPGSKDVAALVQEDRQAAAPVQGDLFADPMPAAPAVPRLEAC
ncbi:putative DNA modification/repair radical SAM protein [Nitrogeniibacter aestuarii]|uniref:putative DNA modification/repair radical SAM protein n=1 Tax=Nitrogeniibacter aestuarii TaxID=2815343 RepID=UPI001D104CC0|nr:putative DNA modification/repair radical SAM protein [Nitrogeniibacter aestuarii]